MKTPRGNIRIIGGKWRGRPLKVLASSALRPTPDRVRETLFNWLSPRLSGAYCLDAFGGTGVLGFEAISRGACQVDMIEQDRELAAQLVASANTLGAENLHIFCDRMPQAIQRLTHRYDIIFLDPPYQSQLLLPTCLALENQQRLNEKALIYLESQKPIAQEDLPPLWQFLHSKRAGQVYYHLAVRNSS